MQNSLIVLPTSRAIREIYLQIDSSIDIAKHISISDFFNKLCIVDNRYSLDDDGYTLLMLEASDFNSFEKLQIPRNFFTFTKNISYITNLFNELSGELYDIAKLKEFDVYDEYIEHIAILEELYKNYEALCERDSVLDKIFLPKLYRFNEAFLKQFSKVEIFLEGYLTNFEFFLLKEVSKKVETVVHFSTSRFNHKMQKKFQSSSFVLQDNFRYMLDLSNTKILHSLKIVPNQNVFSYAFSQRVLQIALIKQKIYEFMKKGYEPSKIAIVLCDESFAKLLREFDKNFNFAMGSSLTWFDSYKKLESMRDFLDEQNQENLHRLNRYNSTLLDELKAIYYDLFDRENFFKFLYNYASEFKQNELDEEIYRFELLSENLKSLTTKAVLNLFLQRLSKKSIDNIGGGTITVMGVLETRGISFDGVVIVDFNENFVPKKSDKDMFLNSYIRQKADLPTSKDRENLQKQYYKSLIDNSKEVAISYVLDERQSGSRFLEELGIKSVVFDERSYYDILFDTSKKSIVKNEDIILEYDLTKERLSNSKFKVFLECKRKYYYKYILKLKEHKIASDVLDEFEVGNLLHEALKRLYSRKKSFDDIEVLKRSFELIVDEFRLHSEYDEYLIMLQKMKLSSFYENEIRRFGDGFEVFLVEKDEECNFCGFNLYGRIDRVDKRDNKLYVLDYKSGSYKIYDEKNLQDATDFQLEFYYLLMQKYGEVASCGYYDMFEHMVVEEIFLKEKLELLEQKLLECASQKIVNFSMCDDIKICRYCSYATMCGRE